MLMVMILIFIFLLAAAIFPDIPMPGARHAAEICLYSVIPSVFPFMVLNYILLKSGAITAFCNRHLTIFGKTFNLPPSAASAVILGFLSGYPVGTKTAGELYENGYLTRAEYRRLTAFCSNAGPAFITGTVGIGMLKSHRSGIFLLIIHILSAICTGLVFRYGQKLSEKPARITYTSKKSVILLFSEGIYDSLKSVALICGFVIFFGAVTSYMLKIPGLPGSLCVSFTEMTNGVSALSALTINTRLKISLVSAAIGWGGICVHAQSFCFLKEKKYYIAGKALQGILSFIFAYATFPLL